jgi:endonuclease/exonuclease/phosphatase family metal-dependent hydrolase
MQITVCTLNVGGLGTPRPPLIPLVQRVPELGRRLAAIAIDVLNLQEVFRYEQLRVLRDHLPAFPHVAYHRGVVGPAGGLVTFSRLPIQRVRYRSFAGIVPNRGRLKFRIRRALLSAVQGLTVAELTGLPVTVVNTHLTANRDNDWSPGNRFFGFQRAQLRRFNATLARWRRPGLTVITGDFNIASDSDHYAEIIDYGLRQDPFAASDPATFHAAFLPPGEATHRIDYVLLSGEATVLDAVPVFPKPVVVGTAPYYLSDHIALAVRIGVS